MSEILMLDVRTLAFVSSVGGLVLAMTMLGIYQAGMRERGILIWFASGLATGGGFLIGYLFQTLGTTLPFWLAANIANTMIALGHGLLLVGVQRYLGRRCWTGIVAAAMVVFFLSPMIFPELRESLRLRVIFHSSWYIAVLTIAAVLLWTAGNAGMRQYHRLAAGVLGVYALFLWVRWFYAVFSDALTTSFVRDGIQAATFLTAMLFGFLIAVALALMMFRKKQLEVQLLAESDPLTGIKNRLTMDRVVADETARADKTESPLGVLLLDVDDFKQVNDVYGHSAGDQALKRVAGIILAELRGDDVAFRYGGEEFLILLPGTGGDNLVRVAERLRSQIARRSLETDEGGVDLTASIGVTEFRYRDEQWDQCLKRVDHSMYKAKR
ncbi:MAG: GGDEF domain-containing protein, partial [Wenzhouxiangellaceae bacterium]